MYLLSVNGKVEIAWFVGVAVGVDGGSVANLCNMEKGTGLDRCQAIRSFNDKTGALVGMF